MKVSELPPPVLKLPESSVIFKQRAAESQKFFDGTYLRELRLDDECNQRQSKDTVLKAEQNVEYSRKNRELVVNSYRASSSKAVTYKPSIHPFYYRGIIPKIVEETIERPPLGEINEFIEEILDGKDYNETLIEAFDIPISKKDLETLEGLNWLNDEVINFYFNLIKERADSIDNYPNVHIFSTFFYAKLSSGPNAYNMLKRWTRKVDIFAHDIILIPVHLGMHWTLISVNCTKKRIAYFDSMNGGLANHGGKKHLKAVYKYLELEHQDKKKSPLPADWKINEEGRGDNDEDLNLPQQENGSDCGMFTCKYAEYLSRREPLNFAQVSVSL